MLRKTTTQHSTKASNKRNNNGFESYSEFQLIPSSSDEADNGSVTLFERGSLNNHSSHLLNLGASRVAYVNHGHSDSDPEETSSLLQWSNNSINNTMTTWNSRRDEPGVPSSLDNPNYSLASGSDPGGSGRDHEDGQNLNNHGNRQSRVRTSADHRRYADAPNNAFLGFCVSVIRCLCL